MFYQNFYKNNTYATILTLCTTTTKNWHLLHSRTPIKSSIINKMSLPERVITITFVAVMTFVVTVLTASLRNPHIKTRINQFCSTLN